MNFNFKTREEYLAYKTEWKARYFDIIAQIRKAAIARRDAERAFSTAAKGLDRWYNAALREPASLMDSAQYKHRGLKAEATALLAERADSKIESGRQRTARLNQVL